MSETENTLGLPRLKAPAPNFALPPKTTAAASASAREGVKYTD